MDEVVAAHARGEEVWVASVGYGLTLHAARVSVVARNGRKQLYRVTTRLGRRVEATANHPLLTFGGWRRVDQLAPGDRVAVPRVLPRSGNRRALPDHELVLLAALIADGNLTQTSPRFCYGTGSEILPEVERAAAAIRAEDGIADSLCLDLCDVAAVRAALGEREPYEILVNNAGTNRPAFFTEVTTEDFDAVFAINVRAAFFVAQVVASALKKAGRPGSIIQMSSQMGHVGGERRTVYCASKHALEGMTKAMALELGPDRIRVNSLCPTFIETPMTRPFFADAGFRARVLDKITLGRLGRVEDIMGAVVFLASDASALMTGASLVVDGGWTAA
jgi:NAD(P)-dependent dehydrogenase (short-subunit alcohol dehydrogenase family)